MRSAAADTVAAVSLIRASRRARRDARHGGRPYHEWEQSLSQEDKEAFRAELRAQEDRVRAFWFGIFTAIGLVAFGSAVIWLFTVIDHVDVSRRVHDALVGIAIVGGLAAYAGRWNFRR
jgi:hypothetical protein